MAAQPWWNPKWTLNFCGETNQVPWHMELFNMPMRNHWLCLQWRSLSGNSVLGQWCHQSWNVSVGYTFKLMLKKVAESQESVFIFKEIICPVDRETSSLRDCLFEDESAYEPAIMSWFWEIWWIDCHGVYAFHSFFNLSVHEQMLILGMGRSVKSTWLYCSHSSMWVFPSMNF